jgi:hypothetical protein
MALAASFTVVFFLLGCPAGSTAGTAVTLNAAAETIVVGSQYQLTATPSQGVSWTSSNGAFATVSSTGLVTGVARGVASITATADGKSATCAVTVASLYIAGGLWNLGATYPDPVYWKDGTPVPLGSIGGCFGQMIATSGSDVYVAGLNIIDGSPWWWNGSSWKALGALPANTGWWYTGMAISGTDVYITANAMGTNVDTPGYWLNGTWKTFTDVTNGKVSGVVVVAGHVYMAGVDSSATPTNPNVPVYWLDGVKHILPQGNDPNGNPNQWGWIEASPGSPTIVASGNNVYIAGVTYGSTSSTEVPIVWKDSQIFFLGTSGVYRVLSIAVHDNDFYVAGIEDSSTASAPTNPCTPVYWKAGVPHTLPYGGSQATAFFIAAAANVYAAGNPTYTWGMPDPCTPLFWKDGSSASLVYVGSDTHAVIRGMTSAGDDVFLFGVTGKGASNGHLDYANDCHPVYWQNGVLHQLSTGIYDSGEVGSGGPYIGLP